MDTMQKSKIFFTLSLLFLFSSCTNSVMTMEKKNRLIISNDESFIRVNVPYVESKRINLGSVYVDQHIIAADDARCIVYEDIRTAAGYRFNHGYKRSIDLIFNTARVDERKGYGNLTLYRLTLRDQNSSTLNLLALTASKKSLKLLYGFDDHELEKLQESLDQNISEVEYDLSATVQRREHCIKSNWQPKLLIMDNLIGKEGGGPIPYRK
jgi:hypothetical protein